MTIGAGAAMADKRLSGQDWQDKLEKAFQSREPFIGHELKPLPLRENTPRTEKVAAYVELEFLVFLEEYSARMGSRSVSEALRRLAIIGAMAEGYHVDEGQSQ